MKRKRHNTSRLARIESKCDVILSELLILRQKRTDSIDCLIDRLHVQAAEMLKQNERLRDGLLKNTEL